MSGNEEYNKLLLQNIERLGSDIRDNQTKNEQTTSEIKDIVAGLKNQLILYVTHLEKDTALKLKATEEKLKSLIHGKEEKLESLIQETVGIFYKKHDDIRVLLQDNKETLTTVVANQATNIENLKDLQEGFEDLSQIVDNHSEILNNLNFKKSKCQKKNLFPIKLNKTIIYAIIISLTCATAVTAKLVLTEQEFNAILKIIHVK